MENNFEHLMLIIFSSIHIMFMLRIYNLYDLVGFISCSFFYYNTKDYAVGCIPSTKINLEPVGCLPKTEFACAQTSSYKIETVLVRTSTMIETLATRHGII